MISWWFAQAILEDLAQEIPQQHQRTSSQRGRRGPAPVGQKHDQHIRVAAGLGQLAVNHPPGARLTDIALGSPQMDIPNAIFFLCKKDLHLSMSPLMNKWLLDQWPSMPKEICTYLSTQGKQTPQRWCSVFIWKLSKSLACLQLPNFSD